MGEFILYAASVGITVAAVFCFFELAATIQVLKFLERQKEGKCRDANSESKTQRVDHADNGERGSDRSHLSAEQMRRDTHRNRCTTKCRHRPHGTH